METIGLGYWLLGVVSSGILKTGVTGLCALTSFDFCALYVSFDVISVG